MIKTSLLCLCLLTGAATSFAQSRTTAIYGTVSDSLSGKPLAYATVEVKTTEGKSAGYASTAENGRFEIKNIAAGRYVLTASFMGYRNTSRTITASGSRFHAGNLLLSENRTQLDEVVVSAIGNAMRVNKDTIEYNASSYRVTENAALEDLIKKLPGAEVDSDGKITVNGEEITKIMIDGKAFFSDDPQIATKNLPANMVEKLQVVNRKSDQARFTGIDDGEEETVINLTVKPGMKNGWFGNASAGAGYKGKYQGGGMVSNLKDDRQLSIIASGNNTNNRGFNDVVGEMMQQGRGNAGGFGGGRQRMNIGGTRLNIGGNGLTTSWLAGANVYDEIGSKLKVTGNYFYNGSETEVAQTGIRQNFFRNDSSSIYRQDESSLTRTQGHRAALELEWTLDTLNSILFRPNINYGLGAFNEQSYYTTSAIGSLLRDTLPVNDGYSRSTGDNRSLSFTGNVLWRHKFKTAGRTFSANASFSYSGNELDGRNYSLTRTMDGNLPEQRDTIDQQYRTDSRRYSTNTRLTYTEPLGGNYYAELSYGVRTSHNSSEKNTFDLDSDGYYTVPDSAYSNYTTSLFVNQQAEFNIRSVQTKYSWTLGVNAQPSYLESDRLGAERLSRNTFNWSPNGRFQYDFSDTESLRANYRGRTNEPSISQLQPVPDNSNPLLVRLGNPDLEAEFRHNLRVFYRRTDPQAFRTMVGMINATFTNDKIVNNIISSSDGKQLTVPTNIDNAYSLSSFFMLTTPFKAGSKFSITTHTGAFFTQNISLTQTVDRLPATDYEVSHLIGQSEQNHTRSLNIHQMLRFGFKGDDIDINLHAQAGYSKAWYSIDEREQDAYWNNNLGGDFIWTLPYDIALSSDARYNFYLGYTDNYNRNTLVWNAELSKSLFRNKQGSLKLRIYDILNEGRGTTRTVTDNYIEDTTSNTLGRYLMLSFTYRFGSFGNSSPERREGGGRRFGPPPGGRF